MQDGPYRLIPLRGREKQIRGYAKVDAELFDELIRWRWYLSAKGYAASGRRVGDRVHQIRMHRHILGLQTGNPLQADHINGDRLDNRRRNLRVVTAAQNSQNMRRPLGRSGYRGVRRNGAGWEAFAGQHYIGTFATTAEADAAARAYRKEHMPFSID